MKSNILVISWWSNCLGLTCLHNLTQYTTDRKIYVVQVGKQLQQMKQFRDYLPPGIEELHYDRKLPGDHWHVCEKIVFELTRNFEGLWLIDHDLFLHENCDNWLDEMDRFFGQTKICMCTPSHVKGQSITNPAMWLSPGRLPIDTPGFAPVPAVTNLTANQPFAPLLPTPHLVTPDKDTFVSAMEYLKPLGMVRHFPLNSDEVADDGLPSFPHHDHIGGLYLFTYKNVPYFLHDLMKKRIEAFNTFYASCPPEWINIEDPFLLKRLKKVTKKISRQSN